MESKNSGEGKTMCNRGIWFHSFMAGQVIATPSTPLFAISRIRVKWITCLDLMELTRGCIYSKQSNLKSNHLILLLMVVKVSFIQHHLFLLLLNPRRSLWSLLSKEP